MGKDGFMNILWLHLQLHQLYHQLWMIWLGQFAMRMVVSYQLIVISRNITHFLLLLRFSTHYFLWGLMVSNWSKCQNISLSRLWWFTFWSLRTQFFLGCFCFFCLRFWNQINLKILKLVAIQRSKDWKDGWIYKRGTGEVGAEIWDSEWVIYWFFLGV